MKKSVKRILDVLYLMIFLVFTMQLTACSRMDYVTRTIKNERSFTEVFDFVVEISNGTDTIEPEQFLNSSFTFISTEGENKVVRHADYVGLSGYDLKAHIAEIPSLSQSPTMSLIVSDTVSVNWIEIFDSEANSVEHWASWEEATNLNDGQFFVRISIHNEIGDYYVNASYLFVLNVE